MALARPLSEMRDQAERLFHEMEEFEFPFLSERRPFGFRERFSATNKWLPPVDISESNGNYQVRVEVPGFKQENLNVEVLEDAVIIRGESRDEHIEDKNTIYRCECHMGSIYRRIPLPGAVKSENTTAELKHGVLKLMLPKREEEKGKRIQIQSK